METPDTAKEKRDPIVNCHSHIFKGDHVPPYLAKTLAGWPFYYLLRVSWVLGALKTWRKWTDLRYSQTPRLGVGYNRRKAYWFAVLSPVKRSGILRLLLFAAGALVAAHAFFILWGWFCPADPKSIATDVKDWLERHRLLFLTHENKLPQWLILLGALVVFAPARNVFRYLFHRIWDLLGMMPGPLMKALWERYLLLARYSIYTDQGDIFIKLRDQYPAGSRFVILPMDMAYMGAGNLSEKGAYLKQMEELAKLKKTHKETFLPFIFADPRRMADKKKDERPYFEYTFDENGKVTLGQNCVLREYLEEHRFSGIKIYPALGYYPFDELLLPLWKYAADQGIPIMTHCIRGVIYYRGKKLRAWDQHPVFQEKLGENLFQPLLLPQMANVNFVTNFTHPMNFLCLLKEPFLRVLVKKAKDERIRQLFGYSGANEPLKHNLQNLKICLGHFGGEDEWQKYLESDRYQMTAQLVRKSRMGIDFMKDSDGNFSHGKLERIWKFVDWYTIICSMMRQHEHVYADISYILHDPVIFPLLKQTLADPTLKDRVLFGTDFYVVRNHRSEKDLLANTRAHLSEEEFDLIARENPKRFLNL